MRGILILTAAVALVSFGQTQAPRGKLTNTGKPMAVEANCSDDEIQALGLSCTREDPCPLYLELTAVESTGTRLFAAGNIHTSTVTLNSILLTSDDGGQSWTEPVERIRTAGLEQIQFLDLETGWISGQLLLSPARDPFLLLTIDGGKSWRRRNVYSDSRNGLVEAFWFDSRTRGLVLIDRVQTGGEGARYELYESMTGGQSWSVREVSRKPIALKRPPTDLESRGWRLRADAASKAYRIERKQGEQWQTAAAFLVAAGSCRPAPVTESADPPPEAAQPETSPPPQTTPRQAPTLNKKGRKP
jgi:hypothetical protein